MAATGLLSLMVTWWSSPIDRGDQNRFGAGLFGERNITPLGYAAFGFVLGVVFGLLIRRALPAMAATLITFLGVRLAFTYLVRPHLISPKHLTASLASVVHGYGSSNGGPDSLFASAPGLPNAWIYSTRIVDSSGHGLTSQTVADACPSLGRGAPVVPPGVGKVSVSAVGPGNGQPDPLTACVTKLSSAYHGLVSYQPASRYWLFQWYETGIFLIAALALAALCFYWIRRRSG